eukprot:TRINITY_DN17152_c0_g1_i2.p1 TRINITY_DN17152_c0_g1~~TRINITY_DN17152_c0_g1_i2.p1  ORF type:complete len:153 (-),score=25.15 TRINITY_DN17152_c0_g1_i2:191-649(-)
MASTRVCSAGMSRSWPCARRGFFSVPRGLDHLCKGHSELQLSEGIASFMKADSNVQRGKIVLERLPALGRIGGGFVGTHAGADIGTRIGGLLIFPTPGTLIGATVGGVVGAELGHACGAFASERLTEHLDRCSPVVPVTPAEQNEDSRTRSG